MAGIVWEVMPADLLLLHGFTQTGASWDGVRRALGRTLPRARARPGGGAVGGRARPARGARPGGVRARGLLDGRPARARARAAAPASGCARSCSSPPRPGSRTRRSGRRGARPTRRSRHRIEAIGVEAFAREWAAQPLFAGQPDGGRRARPRGPAAALGGRARGAAARARDRGHAAAVGSPGRARDAGDARGRRARREVPRDRRADGERLPDAEVVVVAGAGHAVALEDPAAVAEAIAGTHPAVP